MRRLLPLVLALVLSHGSDVPRAEAAASCRLILHGISSYRSQWLIEALKDVEDPRIKKLLAQHEVQESSWLAKREGSTQISNFLEKYVATSLKNEPIVSKRKLGGGISETYLVTFKNGMQGVFKPKPEFWKQVDQDEAWASDLNAEVEAYQFNQILDLGIVPVTVTRQVNGALGSMQVYVHRDSSTPSTATEHSMRIFDYLINNQDRHDGNYFAFKKQVVAIDHGISFEPKVGGAGHNLPLKLAWLVIDESQRSFYDHLREDLTPEVIRQILSGGQSRKIINEVISRRDSLLRKFKSTIGDIPVADAG